MMENRDQLLDHRIRTVSACVQRIPADHGVRPGFEEHQSGGGGLPESQQFICHAAVKILGEEWQTDTKKFRLNAGQECGLAGTGATADEGVLRRLDGENERPDIASD